MPEEEVPNLLMSSTPRGLLLQIFCKSSAHVFIMLWEVTCGMHFKVKKNKYIRKA